MILSKLRGGKAVAALPFFRAARNMVTFCEIGIAGAAAVAGFAILFNLPNNPFVKQPEKATLEYLANTKLLTLDNNPKEFLASELWKRNGAVIMAVRRPG